MTSPPGPDPFASNPFGDIPGNHDPFVSPPIVSGPAPWPHRPPAAGGEVNTLAALSVVSAVVFAPAGAVLGHLALTQIQRTGQRGRERALIGVTLSYVIITVAVVALTVWLATGTTSTPPTAATSPPATPATSTTGERPAPTGPVDASQLPALLLSLEEVKAIMVDVSITAAPPVPNLTAHPPLTSPATPPYPLGAVDPAQCALMLIAGTEQAYQNSGYRGFYQITMDQPGPNGAQSATQTVAVFDDAAAAKKALADYVAQWHACNRLDDAMAGPGRPLAHPTLTDPRGQVTQWGFADVIGPGSWNYYGVDNIRLDPGLPPEELTRNIYSLDHTVGVQDNVLIDTTAAGFVMVFQANELLEGIVERIKKATR